MNFSLIKLIKSAVTGSLLFLSVGCHHSTIASLNLFEGVSLKAHSHVFEKGLSVQEIARQVTVRIFTEQGTGSGVIIGRQGKIYTVLTNAHVLNLGTSRNYQLMTADEQKHRAFSNLYVEFDSLDLAILTFESNRSYQVVKLGTLNDFTSKESLYSAGFPNYNSSDYYSVESTQTWGMKAFRLTEGKFSLWLPKSLPHGYQLGYSNDVKNGMSGGPILNSRGELVGINGRLKYPLQGISVFQFADGTVPSQSLYEQMESLSWGIPITSFRHLIISLINN